MQDKSSTIFKMRFIASKLFKLIQVSCAYSLSVFKVPLFVPIFLKDVWIHFK